MKLDSALREWTKLVGQSRVLSGEDAQINYGRCTTGESRRLAGVLKPLERDHIIPIVKISAQYKVPLYPVSTGHNWGYGTALPPIDDCVILDLSELNKIVDFDAEAGVVTVEPGVTQGQLAEFLDQGEYPFMVPVTGAGPTCSILGNALERGYGITPHTDHFGAVMAIQAVLADGSIYHSAHVGLGGEQLDRLFKWGIGPYLDGLFSQGGFGVVTQMTIVLARRPEKVCSFLFGLKQPEQLGELVLRVREVIARYPGIVGGVNLMNAHRVLAMTAPYPRNRVTAGGTISPEVLHGLCQDNLVLPWTGFGTLYGSKGVVKAAQREIRSILSPLAVRLLFVDSRRIQVLFQIGKLLPPGFRSRLSKKLMILERSLQLVAGCPNQTALPLCYWLKNNLRHDSVMNPAQDGCGLTWYAPLVPMKQEIVIHYVQMVSAIMDKYRLEPLITLTSLSDRCFDSTVPLLFDPDSEAERKNAENCYWELLEEGKKQGFLPYRVGIQTMSWLSENNSSYWQTVRKVKNVLDPDAVISPGRYI
ncbi:FAD-binding protein [Nitrosomonas eutropha]|uniref:FAD-binding protein n=1 Tax=Nitrosomonas eutropha TaxID=916 RepID=UPI0008BD0F12|nr:FAD-binding protein [Nitrosomonas eutropha]SEI83365.1 FAD binding domain-containing protein [Nitrosomonas eutropha]